MNMPPQVQAAVALAANLEAQGKKQAAAEAYRQAIAAAGTADRTLAGMLHINLGNAESGAGNTEGAIDAYQRAADLLAGEKGGAMVQRGYALLNLAGQLLHKDDPRAVKVAAESLRVHRTYPFTTPTDLADAVAQELVARIFIEKKADETEFHDAWKEIKVAPCAALVYSTTFDFISNYLLLMRKAHPDRYPRTRAEVKAWATPELFEEAVALAEGGPDQYQAVRLRQRMQRALLGIPDPDER